MTKKKLNKIKTTKKETKSACEDLKKPTTLEIKQILKI